MQLSNRNRITALIEALLSSFKGRLGRVRPFSITAYAVTLERGARLFFVLHPLGLQHNYYLGVEQLTQDLGFHYQPPSLDAILTATHLLHNWSEVPHWSFGMRYQCNIRPALRQLVGHWMTSAMWVIVLCLVGSPLFLVVILPRSCQWCGEVQGQLLCRPPLDIVLFGVPYTYWGWALLCG